MTNLLTATRPGLAELAEEIRSQTHRHTGPATIATAVADVLERVRPSVQLLTDEEREGDAAGYVRHVLHTESAFSIAAVVWRPGQLTEIHDHITWCSFIVLQGVEFETLYQQDGTRLVKVGELLRGAGSVSGAAPPDDIHRVHNTGATTAITLHVYGADLSVAGSSVRRCYPDELVIRS